MRNLPAMQQRAARLLVRRKAKLEVQRQLALGAAHEVVRDAEDERIVFGDRAAVRVRIVQTAHLRVATLVPRALPVRKMREPEPYV